MRLREWVSVRERFAAVDPARMVVPAAAAYEIEHGTLRSRNPEVRRVQLDRLLRFISVLTFDRRAAKRTAGVQVELEKRGARIDLYDVMMAGTVLTFGCRLITQNVSEFSRVPGLEFEDWY